MRYHASDDGLVSLDVCNGRDCKIYVLFGEVGRIHSLRIVESGDADNLRPH